jgi:threonyl-tRNA synthetase
MARDVLGREWQLSTIQVDFIQPARLGLTYIGEDGQEHTPVVLHRAVTGTTERFMGVIIEHFAGAFPVWLAPVQAVLIPIADRHLEYAQAPPAAESAGLRVEVDERSERMNAKIRDADAEAEDPVRRKSRSPEAEDPLYAGGGRANDRKV